MNEQRPSQEQIDLQAIRGRHAKTFEFMDRHPVGCTAPTFDKERDLRALIAEVERLGVELSDQERSFDLRWEADMRAIKRWQAAHPGKELTWPDHADLCVWLLGEIERLEREREAWKVSSDAWAFQCGKVQNEIAAFKTELIHQGPTSARMPAMEHLHDMLHTDQSGLAAGLEAVMKTVAGYRWTAEGRGPYEWDDDRYRDEMRHMLDAVHLCADEAMRRWKAGGIPRPCCNLVSSAEISPSLQDVVERRYFNALREIADGQYGGGGAMLIAQRALVGAVEIPSEPSQSPQGECPTGDYERAGGDGATGNPGESPAPSDGYTEKGAPTSSPRMKSSGCAVPNVGTGAEQSRGAAAGPADEPAPARCDGCGAILPSCVCPAADEWCTDCSEPHDPLDPLIHPIGASR